VYHGGPPGKPRRRRWLVVVLVVLAVAVVGGVAAAFWFADPIGPRLSAGRPHPVRAAEPTNRPPGAASAPAPPITARNPGWQVIYNSELQLAYEAPPSWKAIGTSYQSRSMSNVTMNHNASFGEYSCGGRNLSRGTLGSTSVPRGDVAAVGTNVARSLADELYAQIPTRQVQTSAPRQVTRDGPKGPVTGVQVDAVVTGPPDPCAASQGEVKVLVLEASDRDVVFVVNGDLQGGPASPASPADADLQRIVDSARPATGN
jgi:hypothetical protein